MSAYKQFLASDVIVTPFEVNKGFTFYSSSFGDPDVQIWTYEGRNSDPETQLGSFNGIRRNLLYNSIKELYYSNYLTSEIGGSPYTASVFLGENEAGNVLIGSSSSQGRYYNYLQTSLTQSRYFPTGSDVEIAVFSIPSRLYGDYIQPNSFVFEYSSSLTIIDDGEGNLNSSEFFEWTSSIASQTIIASAFSIIDSQNIDFSPSITPPLGYTFVSASWANGVGDSPFYDTTTATYVASINASQGIGIGSSKIQTDESIISFQDNGTSFPSDIYLYFTSGSATSGSVEAGENVGNIIYPHGMAVLTNQNLPLSDISTNTDLTCSFSSSYKIFETQYKATIRESEFNFSQNPTIISGSTDGTVYDFVTGSFFQPYVTTVGLYDEYQNLLAVGKLSQPYPLSRTTDTTFYINLDR